MVAKTSRLFSPRVTTSAQGVLCVPSHVEKESSYHYIASLTEALVYARSALERTQIGTQDGGAVPKFALLLAMKKSKADYACAGAQVSPMEQVPRGWPRT